jgi:hypothetical protein
MPNRDLRSLVAALHHHGMPFFIDSVAVTVLRIGADAYRSGAVDG